MTMHNIPPANKPDAWDKYYLALGIIAVVAAVGMFGVVIWGCVWLIDFITGAKS